MWSQDNYFVKFNASPSPGEIATIRCLDEHKKFLLDIFPGYDSRSAGEVFNAGYNCLKISDDERSILDRRYIGIASSKYSLLNTLSIRKNISMPLLLHGYGMESIKITGIIQKLQLQECKDKLPSDISLSEYFRGMCARVFIGSREIVIMNDLYGDLCTEEKVSNKILTCRLAKEMRVTLIYITSILEQ